jgi:ribonuclease BN (tRNA processing enzyme)
MRLTVLGSAASYAAAGQACSGHLVQAGETSVLFDCGNGVLANLSAAMDPLDLDALFITHAHVDHFADVYALQALMRYAPGGPSGPLPLYLGQGLFDRMGCLLSEHGREELAEAFEVHEVADGDEVVVGDMVVGVACVDHIDPTFALIATVAGSRLCFTSDTGMSHAVVEAADGCDLLLAEATLPERYADAAPHLTARQAGEIASQVGASMLVITHVWPTNDRDATLAEAQGAFGGRVAVAREMDAFEVPVR